MTRNFTERIALAALLATMAASPVQAAVNSVFPEITIRKAESRHEWAFSVDEGELSCMQMGALRAVFFSEILADPGSFGNMKLPRMVIVTTDPLVLFASFEDRALYAPFDSLETLIKRLGPYEAMGRKLCAEAVDGKEAK